MHPLEALDSAGAGFWYERKWNATGDMILLNKKISIKNEGKSCQNETKKGKSK